MILFCMRAAVAIALADLTADGLVDIVVGNEGTSIELLIQQSLFVFDSLNNKLGRQCGYFLALP